MYMYYSTAYILYMYKCMYIYTVIHVYIHVYIYSVHVHGAEFHDNILLLDGEITAKQKSLYEVRAIIVCSLVCVNLYIHVHVHVHVHVCVHMLSFMYMCTCIQRVHVYALVYVCSSARLRDR